jgi:hypothetical protein
MSVDTATTTGTVVVEVKGPDGEVKTRHELANLITDAGDLYHVKRVAAGVAPAAGADVAKVTGMKLGTGTTATAKNGTGAALVAYVSGSATAFDTGYPTAASLGAGLGATVTYQTTFGPGVGTNSALTEVVIVTDSASDATSTAAATISRLVFPATPKQAADTLTISWAHKQLGS